jgi:type I restriction enzyme S subunit
MTAAANQKIPVGYKQIEIGVIPMDWDFRPLGDFFTFKNGLNKAKQFFGHGTPIVNYMDVYKNPGLFSMNILGRVNVSSQEIKSFGVKKGDVFFTRTSETVEEIGITSVLLDELDNGVFSGFILRARSQNDELNDLFKKYCFSSNVVRKQITEKSTYTTRALTNGRVLSMVKIPYPPKTEQLSIAIAISDVDTLIEKLAKLIEKKKNIKQGAMQELLTGKRRLPGFCGEWKVKKLGEIAEIKTGKKNNDDKTEEGLYPFFVRSQQIERINSYSFDGEAILIPGEGNIGNIYHYVNGRFDYHQRVYKISNFAEQYSGKFIYLFMSQNFNAHAMKNSVKATVDSLRLPTFQEFEISFPPTRIEQNAIAITLSDMDSEIEKLESQLTKYRNLKQGMMQNLLTGKIRLLKK